MVPCPSDRSLRSVRRSPSPSSPLQKGALVRGSFLHSRGGQCEMTRRGEFSERVECLLLDPPPPAASPGAHAPPPPPPLCPSPWSGPPAPQRRLLQAHQLITMLAGSSEAVATGCVYVCMHACARVCMYEEEGGWVGGGAGASTDDFRGWWQMEQPRRGSSL